MILAQLIKAPCRPSQIPASFNLWQESRLSVQIEFILRIFQCCAKTHKIIKWMISLTEMLSNRGQFFQVVSPPYRSRNKSHFLTFFDFGNTKWRLLVFISDDRKLCLLVRDKIDRIFFLITTTLVCREWLKYLHWYEKNQRKSLS